MDTDSLTVADAANDTVLPDIGHTDQSPDTAGPEPNSEEALEASLSEKFDRLNDAEEHSATSANGTNRADQPYDGTSEQPEMVAIAPPASWSAEMHSHWTTLPPQIQTYVSQREQDASRKISEQGNELGRARPVVDLFDRYQQNFDRHGVSLEDGMASLMQAQEMLDQNPLQGIAAIAETYGIDLPSVFGPAAQQLSPEVQQLVAENRQYQATINNLQRDQRAQQIAEDRAIFNEALEDLGHWSMDKEHFAAVENTMAGLLSSGEADDLDEAYDMACHAVPEIRNELLEAERVRAAEDRRMADAQATRDARRMAQTNIGNRAARPAVAGEFLDDDALSQRFDAIIAG